jgi:hypothetical protein
MKIKDLLKINIAEEVPLVIKAGDQNLELEQKEISQYIVTHQIESHLEKFLLNYKLPSTEKIGVWISGFFGSGKSYFAKILGYLLSNHALPRGITARELFNERVASCANPEFLKASISALNSIPATVIMFEIIGEGSMTEDTVQQVMFKKLLQAGGYSSVPSVAIMEYELDEFGHLEKIREHIKAGGDDYGKITTNAGEFRRLVSRVMAERLGYSLEEAKDFLRSAVDKYKKLTPGEFADHCVAYTEKTGKRLVFIIDEIGQYVTSIKDNDDRILALQAVAEAFSSKGKGSVRLIVTSQEKLDQLIANSNFDKRKLGKLTDRFEVRLDLTSENVDEVARERLLKKKIETEPLFEKTMRDNQGNITTLSNTEGSYKKTETKDDLMNYYPFHPYHFQLIPDFVQNARGKSYQQATTRKFISLVDFILKNLKDEEFGRMVNATDLFDALGPGFFGSEVMALVRSADDYLGRNVKASDILKTLHILKNLTKIKASETVITRLLVKSIYDKEYDLGKEVRDVIDYLVDNRYVTRYNGEIDLVTDLEREFIKEMNETIIDIPKRNEEIVRQLQAISNHRDYREIQYGDGPSVPVEWLFEGNSISSKKKGLKVSVASFTGANVEGIEFESVNHADTVYLIPEENDKIDTLAREIKRLEVSLDSFRTYKTGGDTREILAKYSETMENKKRELTGEIRHSFEKGKLVYVGELISGGNILYKLKEFIKDRVIPAYYTDITATTAKSKDIEDVLTRPQNTLKTVRVDDDHRVFDENGELIETHKIISPVIRSLKEDRTGADLLEEFTSPPYGWTQETVMYSVACLMRGGKITLNNIDSYGKPEVHKAFKSVGEFKNAKIRKSVVLSTEDRNRLIQLINPLLDDGKLSLQSPRSEFIARALDGLKRLYRTLEELKGKMEELGAAVNWELDKTKGLINLLVGGGHDCLDKLLEERTILRELKEIADKTEDFLKKNYEKIKKQRGFLKDIDGEIAKKEFDDGQSEELSALVKEYRDTLPSIASFGTDLDGIFEKLRNTYKGYFNPVHNERDRLLSEIEEYLDSIREERNQLGKRAADQSWFKAPNSPCNELEIRFSTKCEHCHIGFREAVLEIASLKGKLEGLKASYEKFMEERPVTTPPPVRRERLKLKRRLTYLQLKRELEKLTLNDNTEIEIELED